MNHGKTIGNPSCFIMFVICLFVCLFTRSLRSETHLDPDGTRLEQNAHAQARLYTLYQPCGHRNIRQKRIKVKEKRKTMATHNKSSQTILLSAFGSRKWKLCFRLSECGMKTMQDTHMGLYFYVLEKSILLEVI